MDDRGVGVLFPVGARGFSFPMTSRPALGPTCTSVASYAIGTGGYLPEVKRPGLEADHSSPSSSEAKNGGAISHHLLTSS
jgi:hypothetical protein